MQKTGTTYYPLRNRCYSVLMVLALLWLTVSTPFVFAQQQQQKQQQQGIACTDEECSNPFAGTSEEKTESGSNTLSEYLHEILIAERPLAMVAPAFKCHPDSFYFDFHPEMVSPPPESVA